MGLITPEMGSVVEEQRLGFAATICEDGTANLSPKGTVTVLDDDHLMFADLASPPTVKNLRTNPSIAINVVDQVIHKGFRLGARNRGRPRRAVRPAPRAVHLGRTRRAGHEGAVYRFDRGGSCPYLVSPAYDERVTEEEVAARWEAYFLQIGEARRRS